MTLIVGWIGKDSRKISSFYIASDSRFSWNDSSKYDYGRKLFALTNSPDIFGYCGDVQYPTAILSQILDMDRESILFPASASNKERSEILFNEIIQKFGDYPKKHVVGDIEITHVSRDNKIDFICNTFKWTKKDGWGIFPNEIPNTSDKVFVLGTGSSEYIDSYTHYYNGNNGKTSRSLFQGLCHCLFEIKDAKCGGAPQLVGLFNKDNGRNFGIIYNKKRFFLGREIGPSESINNVAWRNELFEICDGNTIEKLDDAQSQPNELSTLGSDPLYLH